jgi:antitoxin component HigA of HigAB toxin-antitoxin module
MASATFPPGCKTRTPSSETTAILAVKRKISATLAGKLARYFNVSPAVFIGA